ncbi:MAG: PAS domain-containing protein [Anaerolineae bacterium]|nr:PAS domain-containing protein [Anaerolineae bacterium]
MTNFNLSQQGLPFPWLNKQPGGLVAFKSLIQWVEKPALLVDRKTGQVWGANAAFLSMSGYVANDMEGAKIVNLLVDVDEKILPILENEPASLRDKNGRLVSVDCSSKGIDGDQRLYVLLMEERKQIDNRIEFLRAAVQSLLLKFSGYSVDDDLGASICEMAELVRLTLEMENVALYQADASNPQLIKLAESGDPEIFPSYISSTNLIRLSRPSMWKSGRRLVTDLHQVVYRCNKTNFLSTPLGSAGKWFGLIVSAGCGDLDDEYLQHIELIGAQISRFFENHFLAEALRREIDELAQHLSIANVVIESAHEGILIVNPKFDLLAMNPAAEWMLGYADREVKGTRIENVLIGAEGLVPALEAALRGIPTHNFGNVSLHRRAGALFPAHIQTVPVGKEGNITAVAVLVSDVSETEDIRNRTQQLEQRAILGEVTAVFAHEVRNPLNNIYSGVQLLAATLPENDPNQENLGRMQTDCNRLIHQMESVLNFSRNTQYRFEPVDMEMFLRRMLDRWRPRFNKVNVTSFLNVEENTPNAYADPRGLEQVFTNLITNAVEAMSKQGGSLALHVGPKHTIPNKPQVSITVSDDGPGIPDEIRDRIFEPFVTHKTSGTGLGLAITKRIVTAHHGTIDVSSFPGGTMFEVTLQAHNGEEE